MGELRSIETRPQAAKAEVGRLLAELAAMNERGEILAIGVAVVTSDDDLRPNRGLWNKFADNDRWAELLASACCLQNDILTKASNG